MLHYYGSYRGLVEELEGSSMSWTALTSMWGSRDDKVFGDVDESYGTQVDALPSFRHGRAVIYAANKAVLCGSTEGGGSGDWVYTHLRGERERTVVLDARNDFALKAARLCGIQDPGPGCLDGFGGMLSPLVYLQARNSDKAAEVGDVYVRSLLRLRRVDCSVTGLFQRGSNVVEAVRWDSGAGVSFTAYEVGEPGVWYRSLVRDDRFEITPFTGPLDLAVSMAVAPPGWFDKPRSGSPHMPRRPFSVESVRWSGLWRALRCDVDWGTTVDRNQVEDLVFTLKCYLTHVPVMHLTIAQDRLLLDLFSGKQFFCGLFEHWLTSDTSSINSMLDEVFLLAIDRLSAVGIKTTQTVLVAGCVLYARAQKVDPGMMNLERWMCWVLMSTGGMWNHFTPYYHRSQPALSDEPIAYTENVPLSEVLHGFMSVDAFVSATNIPWLDAIPNHFHEYVSALSRTRKGTNPLLCLDWLIKEHSSCLEEVSSSFWRHAGGDFCRCYGPGFGLWCFIEDVCDRVLEENKLYIANRGVSIKPLMPCAAVVLPLWLIPDDITREVDNSYERSGRFSPVDAVQLDAFVSRGRMVMAMSGGVGSSSGDMVVARRITAEDRVRYCEVLDLVVEDELSYALSRGLAKTNNKWLQRAAAVQHIAIAESLADTGQSPRRHGHISRLRCLLSAEIPNYMGRRVPSGAVELYSDPLNSRAKGFRSAAAMKIRGALLLCGHCCFFKRRYGESVRARIAPDPRSLSSDFLKAVETFFGIDAESREIEALSVHFSQAMRAGPSQFFRMLLWSQAFGGELLGEVSKTRGQDKLGRRGHCYMAWAGYSVVTMLALPLKCTNDGISRKMLENWGVSLRINTSCKISLWLNQGGSALIPIAGASLCPGPSPGVCHLTDFCAFDASYGGILFEYVPPDLIGKSSRVSEVYALRFRGGYKVAARFFVTKRPFAGACIEQHAVPVCIVAWLRGYWKTEARPLLLECGQGADCLGEMVEDWGSRFIAENLMDILHLSGAFGKETSESSHDIAAGNRKQSWTSGQGVKPQDIPKNIDVIVTTPKVKSKG